MISESMVNRSTDDEPSFKFYCKNFATLRDLMKRSFESIKFLIIDQNFQALTDNQHYFLIELLESLIYMNLDFAINETASAAQM